MHCVHLSATSYLLASSVSRSSHALAYDAVRGVTILYGGLNASSYFSDIWEFDGNSWREVTPTDPEGDGNPNARSSHALTYHASRSRVVLFGGHDASDNYLGDTWEWDGASWARVLGEDASGATAPLPRASHAMSYDATRGVTILFGGQMGRTNSVVDGRSIKC